MRLLILLLFSLCCFTVVQAQFQKTKISDISKKDLQTIQEFEKSQFQNSEDYEIYHTQIPSALLQKTKGPRPLQIIDHEGTLHRFHVKEVQNMMPGLTKKYPHIRSFRGNSNKHPNQRISITTDGQFMYARTQGMVDNFSIQPIWKTQALHAISSVEKASVMDVGTTCLLDDQIISEQFKTKKNLTKSGITAVNLKTYRVAIATTGEYSSQTGGSVSSVLTSINNHLNLVNEVFEREIGAKHLLIDDNDQLIFLDAQTDPYDNSDKSSMLAANSNVINGIIESSAYDFGHVFGQGGGGVANLQVPCTSRKARGVSGLGSVSNFFKLVAHEMGHQFGAGHTWNYCTTTLNSGQRSSASAAEPGSGSTIMSYAGLCPGENVQPDDDPYFHAISIQQIKQFILSGSGKSCATDVTTTNNEPTVNFDYEDGFFIPISTPFQLRGSATDPDGDSLTYNIDQFNFGPASPLGEVDGNAPSFRSFPPDTVPERVFPQLGNILSGSELNVEILPTYERNFTFRFMVRDNNSEVGATVWEEVSFESSISAGPFQVLENGSPDILAGISQPVNWDVANTDNPIVNCKTVNILLSTDGGQTFNDTLAIGTANDGFEFVDFPNMTSSNARLKIEAADNIFFDISDENFSIIDPATPDFSIDLDQTSNNLCIADQADYTISNIPYLGYDQPVNLSIKEGLPMGATAMFSNNPIASNASSTLTIDNLENVTPDVYNITVEAIVQGGSTLEFDVRLNVINGNLDQPVLDVPQDGDFRVPVEVNSEWTGVSNAISYQYQLATDAAFQNIIFDSSAIVIPDLTLSDLSNNQLYFWRTKAINQCGASEYSDISAFYTKNQVCNTYARQQTLEIKSDVVNQVVSTISIDSTFTVGEFKIPYIRGTHEFVGDLQLILQPPTGTNLTLIDQICDDSQDFDIGFDDEAISTPECPINDGQIHQSVNTLSSMNGRDGRGLYILFVKDENIDSGGEFQEWAIEFCADINPAKPVLTNNEGLTLSMGQTKAIETSLLKTSDLDTDDADLLYAVLSVPEKGNLLINSSTASIGSTFTQDEINDALINYQHTGSQSEDDDAFQFIVTDQAGGLIERTTFDINITENTSTLQILDSDLITIYPNPSNGRINIEVLNNGLNINEIALFNINGQLVYRELIDQPTIVNKEVNLIDLPSGVYQLSLFTKDAVITRKVILQQY